MTETAPSVMLRLSLPDQVLQQYQAEAHDLEIPLEDLLASRLSECVTYNATKPIYFNDMQRQRLEKLLDRNVSSAGQVLGLVEKLTTVKLNGIAINLRPPVVERLRTRHFAGEFGEWLAKQVNEWAERYVGLL